MKDDKSLLIYGDFSVGADTAPLGHNRPPSPFDDLAARVAELNELAAGCLFGAEIADQGQADAIAELVNDARKLEKAAADLKKAEKEPHDTAIKEIAARFKPVETTLGLIKDTGKSAQTVWLRKDAEKKAAEEAEKRRVAEEAARKAEEARKAAEASNDIEARAEAVRLAEEAQFQEAQAKKAAKDKAHASGGGRAMHLRSVWSAEMTDEGEALCWAWEDGPAKAAVKDAIQRVANEAVRNGARKIPGFTITEERKAV